MYVEGVVYVEGRYAAAVGGGNGRGRPADCLEAVMGSGKDGLDDGGEGVGGMGEIVWDCRNEADKEAEDDGGGAFLLGCRDAREIVPLPTGCMLPPVRLPRGAVGLEASEIVPGPAGAPIGLRSCPLLLTEEGGGLG